RFIASSLHRFIASSLHRFIASSLHRFIAALAVTCTILTPGLGSSPAQADVGWLDGWGVFRVLHENPSSPSFDTFDNFIGVVDNGNRAPLSPDGSTLDTGFAGLWVGSEHAGNGSFRVSDGQRFVTSNGITVRGGEFSVTGAGAIVETQSIAVYSRPQHHGKLSIADGGVVRIVGQGIGSPLIFGLDIYCVRGDGSRSPDADCAHETELEIDGEGSLLEVTPQSNGRLSFLSSYADVQTSTITVSNGGVFRIDEAAGDYYQVRWDGTKWVQDYISPEEANADPYGAHPDGHLTFNIGAASGEEAVAAGFVDFYKPVPLGGATSQLVFNHTNTDYEFGTAISGAGSVLVENGTTILTHENSYTGGTTIVGGTLAIASANALGTGDATFDGGTLATTEDMALASNVTLSNGGGNLDTAAHTTLTVSSNISGAGSLRKAGSGTLTLTGDSDHTGGTTVSEGALLVNGRVDGAVTLDGGVLGGDGTVGAVTVNRGSTLAPGNSIGTLNVDGDITLTSGSTYAVEVNRDGDADRLAVTGEARVSGATVHVSAENGTDTGITYAPSTRYIILTASGGVVGTFENVTDTFAFLDSNLDYEANEVILILERNERGFHDITDTENQRNVAIGVNSLGADNDIFSAILGLSEEDARRAFDDLSGEAHASIDGLLIQNNSIGRNAVNTRLRSAFDSVAAGNPQAVAVNGADADLNTGTPMAWFEGYGNWSSISETDDTAALDSLTAGFFAGLDTKTHSGWRVGLFGGYGNSSMTVDDRDSSGDADSFVLGAYAGYQLNNFGFRFGASNAWHSITTERDVTIGSFSDALSADYAATAFQAFGEVGYTHTTRIARIEPFTGLALINQRTNDFVEDGGAAALSASTSSQAVGVFSLGTRFEREFAGFGNNAALLSGSLGWRRALGDLDPGKTMSFDGSSDVFTVTGAPVEENTFLVALGLRHEVEGVLLDVGYYSEFGDLAQNQGLNLNASFRF
ncbi:autotransporter domain-containing protein, partial [uncultured Ruegeria sp.]|uniref:autotransporter outer membrane beta-barrel domain-containing protein n=1 Tax=uncultured Ruegeria sp. TaxID=259304 RepID=UPI002611ADF9